MTLQTGVYRTGSETTKSSFLVLQLISFLVLRTNWVPIVVPGHYYMYLHLCGTSLILDFFLSEMQTKL